MNPKIMLSNSFISRFLLISILVCLVKIQAHALAVGHTITSVDSCNGAEVALSVNLGCFNCSVTFWDYGDGTREYITSENVTHTYKKDGIYIVNLRYAGGFAGMGDCYDTVVISGVFSRRTDVVQPTCNGICDGTISLIPSSGNLPYTYAWSNGSTDSLIDNLCAGSYSYTLTEAGGCVKTDTLNLIGPSSLNVSLTSSMGNCQTNNGNIKANPVGGTPPYTYLWTNGATADSIFGLSPGTYGVTVMDVNGCSRVDNATINAPAGPPISAQVYSTSTMCSPTACSDTVFVIASGGTPPYSYNWNQQGAISDSFLTQRCVNQVNSVVVTDVNGCQVFLVDTIQPVMVLDVGIYSSWNGISGTLTPITSNANGTAPYSFQWSNGSGLTNIVVQNTGTYSLTVTDANGCTGTASILLGPCNTTIGATAVPQSPCNTSCTGSIDLTVTSGAAPFSFYWSNGSTSEDITDLCPGWYSLTLNDAMGCAGSYGARISDGTILTYNTGTIDEDCGLVNGVVHVSISSVYGYELTWDANAGNSTDTTVSGLEAGLYHFTVTDAGDCETIDSVLVVEGPMLSSSGSTSATCGQADGSAFVGYVSGAPPVTVSWSNGGSGDTINAIVAGIYMATISDASGCQAVQTVEVLDSCGGIQGKVFEDYNSNGIQDIGEPVLSGLTVTAMPGNLTTLTDQNGNYSIPIAVFGNYTVSLTLPNAQFGCSGQVLLQPVLTLPSPIASYTVSVSGANPIVPGNDFAIHFPPPPCGNISGVVFDDQNANGVQDPGEVGVPNILVELSNGQQVYTNTQGFYQVEVFIDTPVVVGIVLPNNGTAYCNSTPGLTYTQTSPANPGNYTITLSTQNPNSFNNDFGVNGISSQFDVGVYTIRSFGGIHAGRCFTAWMDFKRLGNIPSACTLKLKFDLLVDFVSASLPPDNVGPGFVEWYFPQNSTITGYCIEMEFCLDNAAVAGQELDWLAFWDCGINDGCPDNDRMNRTYAIHTGPAKAEGIGGFNKKEVYHSGDGINNIISEEDTVLSYVITFQNTGVDTAYHLSIRDTISPYLNASSLTRAFSSHDHSYCVTLDNVIVWEFEDILLPDSTTDFMNSYGFVQYNIVVDKSKVYDGLTFGNGACLYWNYDDPNCTNKALLTYDVGVGVEPLIETQLKLYPNPTTGGFTIEMSQLRLEQVEVMDLLGATVYTSGKVQSNSDKYQVMLSGKNAGIYIVKLHTGQGIVTRKLVLMD